MAFPVSRTDINAGAADDDTPNFTPKIREDELLIFFWKNLPELIQEYEERKLYGESGIIIDIRLDRENIAEARPVFYGYGHYKDEECLSRQPLNTMAFRYKGLGTYILPKVCSKDFQSFQEDVIQTSSAVLKQPLNDFYFRPVILDDSTATCKTILNEVKRLSKEHVFDCDNLADNKDLSVKSLKPFDSTKYDGIYSNPNNIPNLVLIVTVKPYEERILEQENSSNLDVPADAFLLGILASKRPIRHDKYFGDTKDDESSYFLIQYFLVDEKLRSKHYGSTIITSLFDYLPSLFPKKGQMICEVQASPQAKGFWEKLGFCVLSNRTNDEDVLMMCKIVKTLPSALEIRLARQLRMMKPILEHMALTSSYMPIENDISSVTTTVNNDISEVRNAKRQRDDWNKKTKATSFRDIINNCEENGCLNLQTKQLTANDMSTVIEHGLNKKQLFELNLSFNPEIGNKGLLLLIEKMKGNTSLKHLILRGNNINDKIAVELAKNINSTHITLLELAHNEIGDEGVIAFISLLCSTDTSLTCICLASNKITDACIRTIELKLQDRPSPKRKIYLRGNELTEVGKERLRNIIATKCTGLEIDI